MAAAQSPLIARAKAPATPASRIAVITGPTVGADRASVPVEFRGSAPGRAGWGAAGSRGLPGHRASPLSGGDSLLQVRVACCNSAATTTPGGAKTLQAVFAVFAVSRVEIVRASSGYADLRGLRAERRGWDSNPRGS
jgi:hypothetical protein